MSRRDRDRVCIKDHEAGHEEVGQCCLRRSICAVISSNVKAVSLSGNARLSGFSDANLGQMAKVASEHDDLIRGRITVGRND